MANRVGEQDYSALALLGVSALDGGITLQNTGVTAGTYGDASHVGQFTVGADGRLTAASNVAISGAGAIYAPMVNGDLPGPTFMVDPLGQCIMTRIA